ncbi:MAG: hypothetical protein IJ130_02695 [Solobacterium sp.]|nr:hypothetical protein [Solobacterium sp.]
MLFQGRLDRAVKFQEEKNRHLHESEYDGEKLYDPEIADEMEKGDMLALILSGCLTILPVCALVLFVIVAAGMLFFHIW